MHTSSENGPALVEHLLHTCGNTRIYQTPIVVGCFFVDSAVLMPGSEHFHIPTRAFVRCAERQHLVGSAFVRHRLAQ